MDVCLNIIEHFMAQYGDVTTAFYSDNGTNFRETDNALRKIYTKNLHQKYQRITVHERFHGTLTHL